MTITFKKIPSPWWENPLRRGTPPLTFQLWTWTWVPFPCPPWLLTKSR